MKTKTHSFLHVFSESSDDGKVLNHPLGVDSFPGAGLSTERTSNTERLFV